MDHAFYLAAIILCIQNAFIASLRINGEKRQIISASSTLNAKDAQRHWNLMKMSHWKYCLLSMRAFYLKIESEIFKNLTLIWKAFIWAMLSNNHLELSLMISKLTLISSLLTINVINARILIMEEWKIVHLT